MNKIFLIGNLTRDPELRATPQGTSVCSFTIAVNKKFAKEQETAFFYRINAWRGLADICGKYLSKGKKVAVLGELDPRLYEAKDGKMHISLDVTADEIEFLSPRNETEAQAELLTAESLETLTSDDLPF